MFIIFRQMMSYLWSHGEFCMRLMVTIRSSKDICVAKTWQTMLSSKQSIIYPVLLLYDFDNDTDGLSSVQLKKCISSVIPICRFLLLIDKLIPQLIRSNNFIKRHNCRQIYFYLLLTCCILEVWNNKTLQDDIIFTSLYMKETPV